MVEQSKQPQMVVAEAIHLLQTFRGADLTQTIYEIEKSLKGVSAQNYSAVLTTSGAKAEVLGAAGLIKQLAGQINVVVHALGILLCLPQILSWNNVSATGNLTSNPWMKLSPGRQAESNNGAAQTLGEFREFQLSAIRCRLSFDGN
jgi:hypothetical protein